MHKATTSLIILAITLFGCTTEEQRSSADHTSHPDVTLGRMEVPENRYATQSRQIGILKIPQTFDTETPILIFNGAFDPITPTSNAEAVLPQLPRALLYEFTKAILYSIVVSTNWCDSLWKAVSPPQKPTAEIPWPLSSFQNNDRVF